MKTKDSKSGSRGRIQLIPVNILFEKHLDPEALLRPHMPGVPAVYIR